MLNPREGHVKLYVRGNTYTLPKYSNRVVNGIEIHLDNLVQYMQRVGDMLYMDCAGSYLRLELNTKTGKLVISRFKNTIVDCYVSQVIVDDINGVLG